MRVAEHKKIGDHVELVYREMTPEEITEMERQQEENPTERTTRYERIEEQVMYTARITDTLLPDEQ